MASREAAPFEANSSMPLMRDTSNQISVTSRGVVNFPMTDQHGNKVSCAASPELLLALKPTLVPLESFDLHREEIEAAASRLYDGRDRRPFVTTDNFRR